MRRLALAIAALAIAGRPPAARGEPPADLVGEDVVLPAGVVEASATLETNLSKRYEREPTSLAPDLVAGVTDALTIGVIESAAATGVIDAGGGLCFRGSAHGCARAYDNTGLDARYALRRGAVAVAARLRVIVRTYHPGKPSARLGAVIRLHRGRFAVTADPQLEVGLANRDRGNRDWLRVPIWLALQPARRIAIALRTGVDGELATFGDTYAIPIGLDVTVQATARVRIAAFVGFPSLGGPQNNFTRRVGWLAVSARFR